MHLQSKFAQKRQEEKKDRKCRKSVTTQIGNFFFHYLFGNSFPQITNEKLVYLLLISDERCISTDNIGCTAQNSQQHNGQDFSIFSKNSEGLFHPK